MQVKLSELMDGDHLIADDGFTCLKKGEQCIVRTDTIGGKYVDCDEGKHFLAVMLDLDDNETLVGFEAE